jgi:hypothetical protein
MRPRTPYGTVSSLFWDGDVGWRLQEAGCEPLILLLYLTSNRHANQLGLYRLPLDQIGRELKVVPRPALVPAFDVLEQLRVAFYDRETEFCWVVEMAGQRMNPTEPDEPLASKDNRWIGVQRAYKELPVNRFLGCFFDRYRVRLQMVNRRPGTGTPEWEFPTGPPRSPLPSPFLRPLPSPLATTVDQITEEQNEQRNRRAESVEAVEKPDRQSAGEEGREQGTLFPIGPVPRRETTVTQATGDVEEAIVTLVLTQLRKLKAWESREELIEATLDLCSQTKALERVRRPLVEVSIARAFRVARERGLEFCCAPGARLMDAPLENRDAG